MHAFQPPLMSANIEILSSRNRLNNHFVEMAKRSCLLEMAGMERNLSKQESAPEPGAFTVLPPIPFSEYAVAPGWFAGQGK